MVTVADWLALTVGVRLLDALALTLPVEDIVAVKEPEADPVALEVGVESIVEAPEDIALGLAVADTLDDVETLPVADPLLDWVAVPDALAVIVALGDTIPLADIDAEAEPVTDGEPVALEVDVGSPVA